MWSAAAGPPLAQAAAIAAAFFYSRAGTYHLVMATKEPMSGTPDPVVDAYKPGIDRTLIRRCISLEALIVSKRAAGRPKDLEAVAELELIRDENAETEDPGE